MSVQPPLFPARYQAHSRTSREAGTSIEPISGKLRRKVFATIGESLDGLTDEEGMELADMPASTYRPRRVELVSIGAVADSGRTRRTKSGRKAVVWIVTF